MPLQWRRSMRDKNAMTAGGNRDWNKPLAYKTARIFRGRFGEWFEASGMTTKQAAAALLEQRAVQRGCTHIRVHRG